MGVQTELEYVLMARYVHVGDHRWFSWLLLKG